MICHYNLDNSKAIVAGAIYEPGPYYHKRQTSYGSQVHNGVEPPYIAVANLCRGAMGQYIKLLVTAESPSVVRNKLIELKRQLGIDSSPLKQPPSELETELTLETVALQSRFAMMKAF